MARKRVVYFAHGKESGPWGTKIQHLAKVAEQLDFAVESPDYSGMDDAQARADKLLSLHPAAEETLVFVGSSMGAWVSLRASEIIRPKGLFLLAPAVGLREFAHPASPPPNAEYAQLIHGWNDDVVPLANVYAFAKEHQLSLQILPSDHRLNDQIPTLERLFQAFLQQCLAQSKPEDPRTEWEREQEANFQRETLRATQPRIPR